jgi:hypothetical protein
MSTSKANLAQPAYNDPNWNTPLNSNFAIVLDALGQITATSVTTANVILTTAQAQKAGLTITGTMTGARTLFLPVSVSGFWFISVNVSGGFVLTIASDNGAGVAAGTTFAPTTGYTYLIYCDGTNVYNAASNAVKISGDTMTGALNLPSNGLNVGSGQLQVTGGNVTTSGQFTATNNVTAYSDERLKEHIKTIDNALHRVRMMRGVSFDMKDTGVRGVGVIAQEIREALPEVVFADNAGYLHVAYGNIVSVLIEAIKELEGRVYQLENSK